MRIIDRNVDFYDYLQDYNDTIVFDRRNSWLLTKQEVLRRIALQVGRGKYIRQMRNENNYRFILLQCGATFWLFYLEITEKDTENYPTDYEMKLIISWKNFNKKREIIKLQTIGIGYPTNELFMEGFWNDRTVNVDKLKAHAKEIATAIDNNDYGEGNNLGVFTKLTSYKLGWKNEEMTIPLLKACGIGNLINPIEIFTAIEEHFSLEKTEAERTEPLEATNSDKIIMHGFDTKTSFRGK